MTRGGVRVVAGTYRGRRLRVPEGRDVRPTADRVKEALFSILGPRLSGARVLDAFAGSGALGIEALSRGAAEVWFVEIARKAALALRANLETLGTTSATRVIQDDALRPDRWGREERFDLVFADPPYRREHGDAVLAAYAGHVTPGGLLVLEHERDAEPAHAAWTRADARHYGDTSLSFFAVSGADDDA